jgi:hypothetical protein
MLDVHPPHHAAHTWRDFFIHIATICVGLLIAIALEQSVEYLHHREQAAELRQTLHDESSQVLHDANDMALATHAQLAFLDQRITDAQTAYFLHRPLAPLPQAKVPAADSPDVPHWRAAKQSGLISNLTQGEITAYSEIEYVQALEQAEVVTWAQISNQVAAVMLMYPKLASGQRDLSRMSPQDLHDYLKLLGQDRIATRELLRGNLLLIGGEQAVQRGERSLPAIYRSEIEPVRADPEFPPGR